MKLLLAEDEKELAKALAVILRHNNYSVDVVHDGDDALSYLENGDYDGAILDIMMPKLDGLSVLRKIRGDGNGIPVLILTAKSEIDDRVAGLELGADDYLPKPFHMSELMARVRSVLRRGKTGGQLTIDMGNISLDPASRIVTIAGSRVELLKKEFDILLYFMQRPNHLVDKVVLAEAVWGDYADESDNFHFVYAQIKNLRRKLEEAGADVELRSVYGFGYKFTETD